MTNKAGGVKIRFAASPEVSSHMVYQASLVQQKKTFLQMTPALNYNLASSLDFGIYRICVRSLFNPFKPSVPFLDIGKQ